VPKKPPLLVAIVGGSGSGKTWLAEKLQASLGRKAIRISLDDFYLDRSHLPPVRRGKLNFDHPRAIDWVGFQRVLRNLRAKREARIPQYDFSTHCRLRATRLVRSRPIVLVDGLWLLRRKSLRHLFAFKIFLDCSADIRLKRRLSRDLISRGRTGASVRDQFRKTVEPMHRRFVVSQKRWADLVLPGSFDSRELGRIAAMVDGKRRQRH